MEVFVCMDDTLCPKPSADAGPDIHSDASDGKWNLRYASTPQVVPKVLCNVWTKQAKGAVYMQDLEDEMKLVRGFDMSSWHAMHAMNKQPAPQDQSMLSWENCGLLVAHIP